MGESKVISKEEQYARYEVKMGFRVSIEDHERHRYTSATENLRENSAIIMEQLNNIGVTLIDIRDLLVMLVNGESHPND